MRKTVLIAGASGLVGVAVTKRFAPEPECEVSGGVAPPATRPARRSIRAGRSHGRRGLRPARAEVAGVTHVVYAALFEKPGLVAGWRDRTRCRPTRMMRNLMDPLRPRPGLRHVSVLQGTKAYGAHVAPPEGPGARGPGPRPARELLLAAGGLHPRPPRRRGLDLHHLAPPSGVRPGARRRDEPDPDHRRLRRDLPRTRTAVRLSRRARPRHRGGGRRPDRPGAGLGGRQRRPRADQTFNITNGDVFVWENVWPAIAAALGLRAGVRRAGAALRDSCTEHAESGTASAPSTASTRRRWPSWSASRTTTPTSCSPGARSGPIAPALVSTIKLRQAGFGDCVDTEAMLHKWFRLFQDKRFLPPT